MRVWRISVAAQSYRASDLSGGRGAARWNGDSDRVVYAAETRSLALLETLVHLNSAGLPQNRYLVGITIPDQVWADREELSLEDLRTRAPTWDAIPSTPESAALGSAWLAAGRSAVLCVPSVIVPEEAVVLINPARVAQSGITAAVIRKIQYEVAQARPSI